MFKCFKAYCMSACEINVYKESKWSYKIITHSTKQNTAVSDPLSKDLFKTMDMERAKGTSISHEIVHEWSAEIIFSFKLFLDRSNGAG